MRVAYDNPVCACNELCTNARLPGTTSTTRNDRPHSHAVDQDASHPKSFFHLPLEIRNIIYFLSFRPDCKHSFSKATPCSKCHVHQSTTGRENAWKWLALCQQTWAEAILYHPVHQCEMTLKVTPDDCARCKYGIVPVFEGAIHAELKPSLGDRYRWRELWLARVRTVTIRLDTDDVDHDRGPLFGDNGHRHDVDRFAHNLESVVSFVEKLGCLKKIILKVMCTFQRTMSTNSAIADSVARLFTILHEKKASRSLEVGIKQAVTVRHASVLHPGTFVRVSNDDTLAPLLQVAASAGFNSGEIATTAFEKKSSRYSTAADIQASANAFTTKYHYAPGTRVGKSANVQPELLWRTAVFDEDFDDVSEAEKTKLEEEEGKHFFYRYPRGPTYMTESGCVRRVCAKYNSISNFEPLYLVEDFYHRSGAGNRFSGYYKLPMCQPHGVLLSSVE